MKQYRNAERTKKWIKKAFTELIAEKKSIDKITINELAARADITKTTFYYHYDDIYAVAEEFENELVSNLSAILEQFVHDGKDDYSDYIDQALSFIKENEESYRLAVNTTDFTYFASKLKNIFYKRAADLPSSVGFSQDAEKRAVQACFIVSACVDTIVQYLKGTLCASLETIGTVLKERIEKLRKNSID